MAPLCELVLFPLPLHRWFYAELVSPSFFQSAGGVIVEMLFCRGLSSPSPIPSRIGAFDLGFTPAEVWKKSGPGV